MKLKLYQNLIHLAYKMLYQLGQVLQLLPLLIQPFGIQGGGRTIFYMGFRGGEPFFTFNLRGGETIFNYIFKYLATVVRHYHCTLP